MKHRPFGKTGFETSEIGFGAWAIGGGWGDQAEEDSLNALSTAIDSGVNFIDTAAGYGDGKSERIIGKFLKDRKEKVYIATKTPPLPGIWPPSPYCNWEDRYPESYLRENIAERMECLGTDHIDLLQLHTWTRAWNRDPKPFEILQQIKDEGKLGAVGISTPEHDQNAVIDLMRNGLVDAVQVIYNLFEQEPTAELLPVAEETGTAIIVRVVFDEGSLTGKYGQDTKFPSGDFRQSYFAGDRIGRAAIRTEAIKEDFAATGLSMPQAALKFALMHPAVSVVIPGMRNAAQAKANCEVSDLPGLAEDLQTRLHRHNWRKGIWYSGK
jgi:aryl-alcohol dehydrogenase-like predicted oxidoreductase